MSTFEERVEAAVAAAHRAVAKPVGERSFEEYEAIQKTRRPEIRTSTTS